MRGWVVVVVAALAAGCGSDTSDEPTQIANPSAVFCEEQGGAYSLADGTCTLPDGSVVDAWDYYRARTGQ